MKPFAIPSNHRNSENQPHDVPSQNKSHIIPDTHTHTHKVKHQPPPKPGQSTIRQQTTIKNYVVETEIGVGVFASLARIRTEPAPPHLPKLDNAVISLSIFQCCESTARCRETGGGLC